LVSSPLARQIVLASVTWAALLGAYAAVFKYWRPEWVHHLGFVPVVLAMPWLMLLDQVGLPVQGYWSGLISIWFGVSLSTALLLVLWAWARRQSHM
jgi:hypothetical protein